MTPYQKTLIIYTTLAFQVSVQPIFSYSSKKQIVLAGDRMSRWEILKQEFQAELQSSDPKCNPLFIIVFLI